MRSKASILTFTIILLLLCIYNLYITKIEKEIAKDGKIVEVLVLEKIGCSYRSCNYKVLLNNKEYNISEKNSSYNDKNIIVGKMHRVLYDSDYDKIQSLYIDIENSILLAYGAFILPILAFYEFIKRVKKKR